MSKTIALVGNPNCGKTTLFNGLTGGKIRTGNWPGVTVEKREGHFTYGEDKVTVVDLPGIYSFSAQSEDEKAARDYALSGEPSMIVNIIDATNLERNLYLTTQLIEMNVPVFLVLNMMDMAEKNKIQIDLKELSKTLSIPVIGISAVQNNDIKNVKEEILKALKNTKVSNSSVAYPNELEDSIAKLQSGLTKTAKDLGVDTRWVAIKILEDDSWVIEKTIANEEITHEVIDKEKNEIESILDDSVDIIAADARYGFIHGIAKQCIKRLENRQSTTDKIDKWVLNKFLGIPLFLGAMYLIFWLTITVGGAFIDFFDIFFGTIFVDGFGTLLTNIGSPEWLVVLLANGIGGGIQTVSTFIPIVFMMFFMLSLLEDSGYMARAAFVMDRFMRFIGLPGKSFVPLLVGFGCTVPAVMATRTLENKKDRLLTIFMAPFMSCGARLPVYALFVAAFFPKNGGLIVFSIYVAGIIFAVLTGLLMKNTLFRGEASYFVMELPPYHAPRLKHIIIHTWDRLKSFVLRSGKAIIIVVAILSLLNSISTKGTFGNEDSEDSLLAAIGKTITPVFTPMGIEKENWPATVGLFTGLFAKEAVVGTLNSLYGQLAAIESGEEEEEFDFWAGISDAFLSIPDALSGIWTAIADPLGLGVLSESDETALANEIGADSGLFQQMQKYFSKGPNQAYAYLLFILLYFPCVAAFGAVWKEAGPFLGSLNAAYLTLLGWIVSVTYYQVTVGHNLIMIGVAMLLLAFIIVGLYILGRKENKALVQ
ncbi:Fe(2+) transporter permease subunit FeoB [Spirochaeta cellobiosiphila]|uniref:Fe(2+) transporter permease subunit FeoB n=1 Tax=Spirochaeta cellobiosiphila TaxID=504483 RepID=UPI00040AFDB8|nr:Fe(2+) transporter permease subunit FeoB [Spirochaeta cellobiosiphila]